MLGDYVVVHLKYQSDEEHFVFEPYVFEKKKQPNYAKTLLTLLYFVRYLV